MIADILNFVHLIFVFIPVIIYFVPAKYLKSIFKYILLIFMITPLHWIFFDDQCIFTMFTKTVDRSTENPASFSEDYMGWFYKPIADSIGWSRDAVSYTHLTLPTT